MQKKVLLKCLGALDGILVFTKMEQIQYSDAQCTMLYSDLLQMKGMIDRNGTTFDHRDTYDHPEGSELDE